MPNIIVIMDYYKAAILDIQGDLCNSDECFLGISPKLVEVQSSITVQKKHNTQKRKSGTFLEVNISG